MGNGDPKASFYLFVDTEKKNLLLKGDYSTVEDYDILPKHLIQFNRECIYHYKFESEFKDFAKEKFF